MFKNFRAMLQEASAYLTFWPFVGGTAVTSAISALGAYLTKALAAYAPASWIAAAILGALAFIIIAGGVVAIRNAAINGSIRRRFYEGANRIDPMKRQFDRERIAIADLVPPMGGSIRDKTFEECELIGPANIILQGTGGAILAGNHFNQCDAVATRDGALCATATTFLDCRFLRCHFFNVAIFVHEDVYVAANSAIAGLNWITPAPQTLFRAAAPAATPAQVGASPPAGGSAPPSP